MKILTAAALVVVTAVCVCAVAPARAADPSLVPPKVALIGSPGSSGQVRILAGFSGFASTPNVDLHSPASGVLVRDVELSLSAPGTGTVQFTVDYTGSAPNKFGVTVLAHDGSTGGSLEHLLSREIVVQRK